MERTVEQMLEDAAENRTKSGDNKEWVSVREIRRLKRRKGAKVLANVVEGGGPYSIDLAYEGFQFVAATERPLKI